MREAVNGLGAQPMKTGGQAMMRDNCSSARCSSMSYAPTTYAALTPANQHPSKWALHRDGGAIYSPAPQWVVTGEQRHADKAIAMLNAWGRTYQNRETQAGCQKTTILLKRVHNTKGW